MGKIIAAILLSCFSVAVSAQPRIMAPLETIDMGTIVWQTPTTATFLLKNKGNQPLEIRDVLTSCDCVTAEWQKTVVQPDSDILVRAIFDAKMLGHFKKALVVFSNASGSPVELYIQGDVVSSLDDAETAEFTYTMGTVSIDKNLLEFDDVNRGDMPQAIIHLRNNGTASYTPTLMHLPPYLSAKAEPERVAAGRQGKITLTLDSKKLNFMGLNLTNIYLARFMGDKVGEDNEITATAILLPDFSGQTPEKVAVAPKLKLSTTEMTLGKVNGKRKKSDEIILQNIGKSNLEINTLQLYNKAITVSLGKRTLAPGEQTKLKISLAASKYLRKAKGTPRVLMITNDPSSPKRIISVNVKP